MARNCNDRPGGGKDGGRGRRPERPPGALRDRPVILPFPVLLPFRRAPRRRTRPPGRAA
jgi:hypothetical protein